MELAGLAVFLGVGAGLVGGVLCAYFVARTLLRRIIEPQYHALGVTLAVIGALAVLLPSFFLSFVVGGNLGGAWAAYVTEPLSAEAVGIPFGLAVGIALVLAIGLLVGALFGIWITKGVILLRQWRLRT